MKRWAKEDRYSWENSEVMREFESRILSNYSFLEKSAEQKLTQKSVEALKQTAVETTKVLKDLNNAMSAPISAADDGEMEDDIQECQHDETDDCSLCRESDDYSDDEVKLAKDEILSHLHKMADDAIRSGNIKLAYRIERTISEVEEG